MKTLAAIVLGISMVCGARAFAAPPEKTSPLVGRWSVDLSRLPMPEQARPKSVTIVFGAAGEGKWSTQVEIVDAGGGKTHAESVVSLDGTPMPVQGSTETDIAAAKMPTPDVLVMQLGKNGNPASTRIYAVAADGRTMVETAAYFAQDGKPILRTNYFTRVR